MTDSHHEPRDSSNAQIF